MTNRLLLSFVFILGLSFFTLAQQVEIENFSVSTNGQAQLSIQAEADKYYILHAQHATNFNWPVAMVKGVDGSMLISDPAGAYPLGAYVITQHDISSPGDYDGDGIDDITELGNMPTDAPLNYAYSIDFIDGVTSIPDAETFMALATQTDVGWADFLDGQLYVKFGILESETQEPKVYFINSNTHIIHGDFWDAIDANAWGNGYSSGEIVFNPNVILPGGIVGTYSFNFSFGEAYDFEFTQRTYELLAANMPFLQNNLNHFIGSSEESIHINEYAEDFEGSRIEVILESEAFADIDFIPFHEAEGYGFFRHMQDLNETPGSRDIVVYDVLPNSLPRVGGIITSVIQTPLSHVNLRAIQDNVPNAYIRDPLSIDSIANLLGGYVYYKVGNETFQIREASLEEVNEWYEALRPTEPQYPVRDLSIKEILPLDDIEFEMSVAFGAKCSNVATMRTFGFPQGTIPDGFGIPFYYYDEFMKHNGFYQEAQVMIDNPIFRTDINFRIQRLADFREDIKNASMPQWMLDDLQAMHDGFPEGTSVRCRSSTNNEDLPGFSGAGLYTSKTQNLDEGHISKSIKQVYASMWNFRAYEERDFYRVDHFLAAMGVLCHPNFKDEKSNGVGISIDPIYQTDSTFYLNTQVGESLITNPDPNSVPEEILLFENPGQGEGYIVLRLSNLVGNGELVMDQIYLDQMRDYLSVIHEEFAVLYEVEGVEGFAMDIEYKVTAENQLIIKQARPWVSFWAEVTSENDLGVEKFVSPISSSNLGDNEIVRVQVANFGLNAMSDFDLALIIDGQLVEILSIPDVIEPFSDGEFEFTIPQDFSALGNYEITCIVSNPNDEYERNDTLTYILEKIPQLDASLSIGEVNGLCDGVLSVEAIVSNLGDTMISDLEIQVFANGELVEVVQESVDLLFQDQGVVVIEIDENLQATDNDIDLVLSKVNGQLDQNDVNNSDSKMTDLDSDYEVITLIINADNYPEETYWELIDQRSSQVMASGDVNNVSGLFTEEICVNYSSCFTLNVYDSFGDGICCGYGEGDFKVIDIEGNELVYNNGDFGAQATEVFCPDGTGCAITADIEITHATQEAGSITIFTRSGVGPFSYSIDGGSTFQSSNSFSDLTAGEYTIVIHGGVEFCSYEEVVTVENCSFEAVEIESTNASEVTMADGSMIINPVSGNGPYQYSIDGGQNFVSENEFYGLAVGNYNVVVLDANAVCAYELVVIIGAGGEGQIADPIVVINEINYNASDDFDTGDWIELYNTTEDNLDVSGWIMRDDDDSHSFVLPEGTSMEGNGFLILTRDQERFLSEFPDVETVVGDFDFGLSSNGDAVRLYNSQEALVDEVYYLSEAPWPTSPNGEGFTLELISPELDNSMAENWAPINFHGSPDEVNVMVNTEEVADGNLQVICFPNPATQFVTIQIESSSEWSEDVRVEIYDHLGYHVREGSIIPNEGGEKRISLEGLSSGAYLVKCYNSTFAKSFVVLKM